LATAQTPPPAFTPGELIVGFESQEHRQQLKQKLTDAVTLRGERADSVQAEDVGDTALRIRIEPGPRVRGATRNDPAAELQVLQEKAKEFRDADPRIRYAHPNWQVRMHPLPSRPAFDLRGLDKIVTSYSAAPGMPNDYAFVKGLHWHYAAPPMGMNAIGAWKLETGSKDVVVAVIDTGILGNHPDIHDSGNVLPGYNFVSKTGRSADPTDPGDACPEGNQPESSWHGTHVAGTIGAAGSNNARGIAGINWNVSVLPVRVLARCGNGDFSDVAEAIRWAAGLPIRGIPANKHPAHVINLSLGTLIPCNQEQAGVLIDALVGARKAGSIVVASAGNDAQDVSGTTPAGCKGVISVAASDRAGHLARYSNFGRVTIMAPGGDTEKTDENGNPAGVWSTVQVSSLAPEGIVPDQGTSMAAPHVSGAIALALAKHPDWRGKPDLIAQKLRESAVPAVAGACPVSCGAGQLDAMRLLEAK
jgi:serine protease